MSEQDEQGDDDDVESRVDAQLYLLRKLSRRPVHTEASAQDSKPQGRVVVVDIGDTTHGHKGNVVQEPSDDRVQASIVDLVELMRLEIIISSLPADKIPKNDQTEDTKGGGGAPVDNGVTKKEIFDN